MPAPNRRNKGEALAHRIKSHVAAKVMDDRDSLVASRTRQAKKWDEAAARLSPAARSLAEKRGAPDQDKREQIEAQSNQQNSTTAFRLVLDKPCPTHVAAPGEPCWRLTASESTATKPVVCGRRISAGGFRR